MCDQLGWDFALLILPLSQRIMSDMPYFITTIIRCVVCWVGIWEIFALFHLLDHNHTSVTC